MSKSSKKIIQVFCAPFGLCTLGLKVFEGDIDGNYRGSSTFNMLANRQAFFCFYLPSILFCLGEYAFPF
ncbi:hypothetical protein V5799_026307 [Amblyomma americanum]|uniref:Uncharacterized protein n=1 Tax=Amblyomma americanum TaxID=6943 RepID=A0AAQ4DIY6_AMBAM